MKNDNKYAQSDLERLGPGRVPYVISSVEKDVSGFCD